MKKKAKIKSTGEIIEVEPINNNIYGRTDGPVELFLRDQLDFGLDNPHSEEIISGWLARDQPRSFSERGRLRLFHHMPHRDYCGNRLVICGFWNEAIFPAWRLDENLFPSLTWQDEPIEVEVTIKPKK